MVFSSIVFLFIFLPIVLILNYVLPGIKLKNLALLIASLFFYAWGENELVLLMIASSLINYAFGLGINKNGRRKTLILGIGIGINLLFLVYLKYFNFIIDSVNYVTPQGLEIVVGNVHLPIGISFFTFQSISYLVDVYRRDAVLQRNPLNLALYISLFPQLIAGPIVRYQTIALELTNRKVTIENFSLGIKRFVIGLGKKVLIANVMGSLADQIMVIPAENLNTSAVWLGIIAYALQIYFDFSGYSDMAIGLGKMLGFNFLENFNLPYISKSIKEFWRRWHISLSTWFRDYLYIPLGGNRKGKIRTYVNLIIVFFLTGLWHGASWSFVFWGIYHGIFIIIEKLGFDKILNRSKVFSHFYTIIVVLVGWVFFRIEKIDDAFKYVVRMFSFTSSRQYFYASDIINNEHIIILVVGVLFSISILQNFRNKIKLFINKNNILINITRYLEILVLLVIMFISVISLAANTYNPFIYFRF